MGKIAKESIEMFAVEGGKVEKASNRMWVIANMVEDQLAHGSRESILDLAKDLATPIHSLLRQITENDRTALMTGEADLSNPVVAAYYMGKFVMAQTMLHDVGIATIATPDLEYVKTPEVMTVLRAVGELDRATDEDIAEKSGIDLKRTTAILEKTYEIGVTYCVMQGKKRVNGLGPCGKQVVEQEK